ncbi:MAG: hypothetical protein CVU64_18405 [Deltaproteobacteria bacterium HGW-Deltaproteobacteria-21]|nr:MAG: hypothetical protein CVU64_18405 [Deltaproteobacteria bacterium HGW-Deltaproteobacteria-21]
MNPLGGLQAFLRTRKAMTKKLKETMERYYSTRVLKAATLRCQHPNWTEERVRQEILDILSDAADRCVHRRGAESAERLLFLNGGRCLH